MLEWFRSAAPYLDQCGVAFALGLIVSPVMLAWHLREVRALRNWAGMPLRARRRRRKSLERSSDSIGGGDSAGGS